MSVLEVTIEELKMLPPSQQDEAAKFIHALHASVAAQKEAVLKKPLVVLVRLKLTSGKPPLKNAAKLTMKAGSALLLDSCAVIAHFKRSESAFSAIRVKRRT